ncbi:hypothetical protein [Phaffia rhodozyma]|uniref:Uncharacterized protein n=1 Tax=Phaffia rhodozyma TaxID=264483 RepID=A0A0F7SLX3_PHARH|nr:hypothetical protein [Phaffia rhodozyma]
MERIESPHKRRRLSPSASPAISSPKSFTSREPSAPSSTVVKHEDLAGAHVEPVETSSGVRIMDEDEIVKLPAGTLPSDVASPLPISSSTVNLKSGDSKINKADSIESPTDDDDPLAEIDFSLLSHTPNVDTQTNLALFDPSSMVLDFSSLGQSFLFDLPTELESALAAANGNGQSGEAEVGGEAPGVADGVGLDNFLGLGHGATGFLGGMASVGATPLGSPDLKALAESLVQDSPAVSPKPLALGKPGLTSNSKDSNTRPIVQSKAEPTVSIISSPAIPSPTPKDTPAVIPLTVELSPPISSPPVISPSGATSSRASTPVAAVVTVRPNLSSSPKPKSFSSSPSLSVPSASSTSTSIVSSSTSIQPQLSLPLKQSPAPRPMLPATITKPILAVPKAVPVVKKSVIAKSNPTPTPTPPIARPPTHPPVPDVSTTKSKPGPIVALDDISLDPNALPPELMSFDFAALEASVLAGMAPSESSSGPTVTSTNTDATAAKTGTATTAAPPPLVNTQSLPTLPTLASTSSGAQNHPTTTSGPTHSSFTAPGPVHISRPITSQALKTNQPVGTRSQTAPVPTLRTMNPAAYGRPPAQTVNLNTVLTGINSLLASPSIGQASAFSTVNPDMSTPGSMWSVEDRKHYLSLLPSSSLVQIILKLTETHPGLMAYPRALSDVVLQLEVQALKPKSVPQGGVGVGHRVGVAQSSVGVVGGQQQRYAVRPGGQPAHQTGNVQGRPALYHPPGVRPVGVRPGVRPVVGGPKPTLASNGGGGVTVRPSASPMTPTARPRAINPLANSSMGRSSNPNASLTQNHNPSIRPSGVPHTIPKLAALHTSSPPSAAGGTNSVRPKGAGVGSPLSRPPSFNQAQAQGPGQGHGAAALQAAQAQAGMAALMSQLLPSRTPSPATGPTTNGGRTVDGNGTVPKGPT